MSHHYSGPDFGFPRGDARLDFTDLYAFPKPSNPGKSILVMNVHPSAVVTPPGPTTAEPFAPEALYELRIDTNGDAIADIAYRVRFSASKDGPQSGWRRWLPLRPRPIRGKNDADLCSVLPTSLGQGPTSCAPCSR